MPPQRATELEEAKQKKSYLGAREVSYRKVTRESMLNKFSKIHYTDSSQCLLHS